MSTEGFIRPEYPRPDFERKEWMNLNGEWEFEFDDRNIGDTEKWYQKNIVFSKKITVPFAFQSKLSGIGDANFHDTVWYRRKFILPYGFINKNIILHFGAIDYEADIWINGYHAKFHEGGFTPFEVDITNFLSTGENKIVVKAVDFSRDITLPRGKQYWKEKSESIWYTNTTGIWQTVWIEAVNNIYIQKVKFTPYIDTNEIEIKSFIHGCEAGENLFLKVKIAFLGELLTEDIYRISNSAETRRIRLNEFNEHHVSRLWTPETPYLHDVFFELISDDTVIDEVKSYFGMRKISVEAGKILLNNRPYYMKLVLDQGYFPDGILTAPTDEAIKEDIYFAKSMGFNGVRKHQKIEDPRFLYWCDHIGLLVWGEMPGALDFSEEYQRRYIVEWQACIERDYNHPCIVVWVGLNESWGVPKIMNDHDQQNYALSLYYFIKSLDNTRLVVSNDGWELVKTDLCNIHDYEYRGDILEKRYESVDSAISSLPGKRRIYACGFEYEGQPILITECGGIQFKKTDLSGWGYSKATDDEDYIKRLANILRPLMSSSVIQGFCYTQLTDVEQEINGLLTYDRVPKVPVERIKSIIDGE